jgi:hypothetical protein
MSVWTAIKAYETAYLELTYQAKQVKQQNTYENIKAYKRHLEEFETLHKTLGNFITMELQNVQKHTEKNLNLFRQNNST